jgi:hypothetical protein
MIGDFKSELCPVEFCKQCGKEGGSEDVEKMLMNYKLKWIPCSERLPEAGVSVIVTSKGGYVYTSNIAHGEWEYGGNVIAWMPLPEPWKRENE